MASRKTLTDAMEMLGPTGEISICADKDTMAYRITMESGGENERVSARRYVSFAQAAMSEIDPVMLEITMMADDIARERKARTNGK